MGVMEIKNKDLLAMCKARNAKRSKRDWCWRLAAALRLRRIKEGSISDFATRTGLSEDVLGKMEDGTDYSSTESLSHLIVFAEALGFSDIPELVADADTVISDDIKTLEQNAADFLQRARPFLSQ